MEKISTPKKAKKERYSFDLNDGSFYIPRKIRLLLERYNRIFKDKKTAPS